MRFNCTVIIVFRMPEGQENVLTKAKVNILAYLKSVGTPNMNSGNRMNDYTIQTARFGKSLPFIEPQDKILYFNEVTPFFPRKMKALYFRDSYVDLFEKILFNLNNPDSSACLTGMAITGNPGIGKSVFLFYVMWRISSMKEVGTVILRRAKDYGLIYVLDKDGCCVTRNLGDIDEFLLRSNTWYLTDTLDPQPGELKAVTILVSPPSRHYYNQFIKYSMTDSLRYLPVWSLEELQECAALYQMTPTAIEEEYSLIGGIPRFVLEKGSSNFFQNGMVNGEIGRLIHDNFKLLAPEYEISELVVHDIVNSDFQKTGIQFAST